MRAIVVAAALGALRAADLDLVPGRYVVLSNESEALSALVAVLSGRQPPRSGRVILDGQPPVSGPATRRKIAALFAEEALPPASTVIGSVGKALAARGAAPDSAATLLSQAGLGHLGGLLPATLGQRETRSIALALALGHDSAELVVLHEPLATLLAAPFVLTALDAHTARGAIVLSVTTSPADATALGGSWLCLELGRLRAAETTTARLGAGAWQQVLVETNDARALAQLLLDSPHGLSTELGASAESLRVAGPALDITVQTLIELSRKHELEIRRIEPAVPPVEALMAARAGFARGAYEASRSAALGGAPPSGYGTGPSRPAGSP